MELLICLVIIAALMVMIVGGFLMPPARPIVKPRKVGFDAESGWELM